MNMRKGFTPENFIKNFKGFTPENFIKNFKGFTLLELIIVIIILGILVGVGITNYTTSIERAKGDAYINNMRTILNAWRIYNLKEATDYTTGGSSQTISWINNKFKIFLTESSFGYGTTTPGARLRSYTSDANANARYLQVRGNRISNTSRYILCNYYYLRNANMWEWTGTWPWSPANE